METSFQDAEGVGEHLTVHGSELQKAPASLARHTLCVCTRAFVKSRVA
jgi:hypothetical protein